MTAINPEVLLTLDDSVAEVLGLLTGLDLAYDPTMDRYRAITRQLNRALRANALEHEWSYYSGTTSVGVAEDGITAVTLSNTLRPRVTGDDAARLVDSEDRIITWAYFLPRDALHKYQARAGLWCAVAKNILMFSRGFYDHELGLDIQVPVMREPTMFRLPDAGEEVTDDDRGQLLDFSYPDLVIARAAFFYAQSDPIMQPRVPTLEAQYKDLMYQVIERDDRSTDATYLNDFFVPVQNGLSSARLDHTHPHSDERWW